MASSDGLDKTRPALINRPEPHESNLPFTSPPNPSNPAVRGYILYYLSQVVARSTLVQNILWSNAGFDGLRNRAELDGVSPRYDPTVVKPSSNSDGDVQAKQPHSESAHLSALSAEDWSSKQPSNNIYPTSLDYHEAYKTGKFTPSDVVEVLLPLIRRDVPSPTDHATSFLDSKVALIRAAAKESTARYAAGKPLSPLDGVPMAVKDESDIAGYTRSLASKLDFTRKDDATSFQVRALLSAGAICLGKTNMHELGVDTTNCNPLTGTPRNPYARQFFCGGSSGGSAYAVGAGLVPFAAGNDGGGSIRIPASYCGVYGLKTSHGRVSIRPTRTLAKSTGVAGPIGANMIDLELAYRVMAQPDAEDVDSAAFAAPSSVPHPLRTSSSNPPPRLLGICKQWISRADPEAQSLFNATISQLTTQYGYRTIDIHLPLLAEGQLAHAMTILAEISSGVSSPASRAKLSPATQVLLYTGSRTPATDFLQAQRVRELIMSHLAALYEEFPGLMIVSPTTRNVGWRIHPGDIHLGFSDANMALKNMEFVWLANFAGCPAISAPVGFVDEGNADGKVRGGKGRVPVGIMGMGEWGDDEGCLAFGYCVEGAFNGAAGQSLPVEGGERRGREKPETFVDVMELVRKGTE